MQAEILFCDNHILVANKPAGMLTQDRSRQNLEDLAKAWVKKEFEKKGNVFLHAVHRLDKEVSGLVLFARTSKALTRLNEEMRKRKIQKIYYALVEGVIEEKTGTLKDDLIHKNFRAEVVTEKGKPAALSYKVIHEKKDSLIEIELHTGRYHQIRVQLAHFGHPIVGDQKYGSKKIRKRIYLHHYKMSFMHPTKRKRVDFIAPSPF